MEETRLPRKYYVDFENVHSAGLKGIEHLTADDSVFLFYSPAAETIHIESVIQIRNSAADIKWFKIDGGTRNAADFQLITALFSRIQDGCEYFIVSADGGFDAAIKMAKRLQLPNVRRVANLCTQETSPKQKGVAKPEIESIKVSGATSKASEASKRERVDAFLVENGVSLKKQQLSLTMKALNESKNKQTFYRIFVQEEGQQKGLALYRRIRDFYDGLKAIDGNK